MRGHHSWHRGENFENLPSWINGNCLSGVFLVQLLHFMSEVLFVIKLIVFVLAYIMSNIALVHITQKILLQNFLIRLGENLLEFYLLSIGLLFLDRKD